MILIHIYRGFTAVLKNPAIPSLIIVSPRLKVCMQAHHPEPITANLSTWKGDLNSVERCYHEHEYILINKPWKHYCVYLSLLEMPAH